MASDARKTRAQLIEELRKLRGRLAEQEGAAERAPAEGQLRTVRVPEVFHPPFLRAQDYVQRYFGASSGDPEHGTVEFSGERYILVRAASMSVEFFDLVASLYADRGEAEARNVANGFLFDIAHALGKADAKAFHAKMGVSDPLEKLSAGPIHFAYSGWAFVDIFPESHPSADEDYYLIYDHPFSFEADSWLRRDKRTDFPVCVMGAGYSSGWCEESFGVPLVAVEIECRARGDEHCRFIMAPPARIEEHLERYRAGAADLSARPESLTVPEFFQRKRLEEALKNSEERWRSLVENVPNLILTVDRQGVVLSLNRTVSGLSVEKVIGTCLVDYLEPEFHEIATGAVEHVFRTGETTNYQVRGAGPAGSTSWYENYVGPVKRAGQVVAATLLVTDITERKKTEEALKDSEERWRSLVENAPNIVLIVDRDGVIQFVNRTVPGLRAEEVIGRSQLDYLEPEYHEVVTETIERVFRTGETSSYQVRGAGPEGSISWYETYVGPVKRAGQVVAATLVVTDITERKVAEDFLKNSKQELERRVAERTAELAAANQRLKRELAERERAERALRESEDRYRSIVEDQTELICRFEPEGILTFVNQAYCRHFGRSSDDLVGRSFLSLIPEKDRAAVLDRLMSLTPENSVKTHEHPVIEPDGSIGWQQWTDRAFFDDDGELVNFQAVGRDITARKRAEEVLAERHAELVRANRELERLHRAKDEFVAMISHELRTPLVTGLGYIELFLEGHLGPTSAEATAGMGVALRNLRRLSGMIDDILGYHSLVRGEGRGGPLLVSFDPVEMLRECREEFLVRSGRDGSGVAVDVDEDLPAVRADEDMIRRVIANLLDNADRHAGPGAHVRLAARAEGDRVLISVSDDGPGMSEETQAQVFEPFVKLSGQREGTGLGLAIVRSVLEAHGSEPTLKSAPGRGTEVAFRLPATPRRGAAEGRESGSARLRRIAEEGPRVLVVDDDEDTLDLVKLALDGQGYRVRTAPSAESALVLLGEKPADLAIVDLSLPGMDGAELCARLKENPATARMPVYMFSARAERAARDRARAVGCDGYIVKPIVMEEFLATVAGALKGES